MAENSKIEWTDHTFNPWVGCTKISPACDHCYAEGWARRTGGAALWQGERRRTSVANWRLPVKWNKAAELAGTRMRVFCASLADVFDNRVPEEWRRDLFDLIRATSHLDWQLLTKRPQNIAKMLPADWGAGWPHVWLGTTVADQVEADRNIPHLLAVLAAKRFLSCEPLLGRVNLNKVCHSESAAEPLHSSWNGVRKVRFLIDALRGVTSFGWRGLDWVIAGGESGPGARPMHPAWPRALRDQCHAAGVPFFFKQWGEWLPEEDAYDRSLAAIEAGPPLGGMFRVGKKAAGALLDGVEWKQMPSPQVPA